MIGTFHDLMADILRKKPVSRALIHVLLFCRQPQPILISDQIIEADDELRWQPS